MLKNLYYFIILINIKQLKKKFCKLSNAFLFSLRASKSISLFCFYLYNWQSALDYRIYMHSFVGSVLNPRFRCGVSLLKF